VQDRESAQVTAGQTSGSEAVLRFGPFELDASRRRLTRGGSPVALTPKAVDLLAVLVRRGGELVTKEDLLKEVWPDTAVEENNLARHVSMLRKAFHDITGSADYIVTVQGRGYRFVGPVRAGDPPAAAPIERDTAGTRSFSVVGRFALVGAIAFVAASTFWFARRGAIAPVQRALGQLTYEPGLQLEPAWSPDGKRLAYASDQAGNFDIWVTPVGSPDEVRLTTSAAQDWQPAWSPDGRWLAFRSERDGGGLYLVAADGGEERRLTTFGYRPKWSPSGSSILFSTSAFDVPRGSFYLVGLDGRAPRPLDLGSMARPVYVSWFPEGDRLSVWHGGHNTETTFATVSLTTGYEVRSLIPAGIVRALREADVTLGRFVWSPSRRYLFFEGRSQEVSGVWRVGVDPQTLAWKDGPERLSTGTADNTGIAVSADGKRLAFSSQEVLTRLWALPLDLAAGRLTGEGRALTSGGAGEFDAAAPADGRKIAFRRIRGGRQEVWEQPTDSGRARLLVASRDWRMSSPRWSMDGTRLAFYRSRPQSDDASSHATVIISPDTGDQRVIATPPGSSLVPDDWSADGGWIVGACRGAAGEPLGICSLSVSGGVRSWRLVAADPSKSLLSPRFSPDQRWVSFMAVDRANPGVSRIYVMPASGGPWIPITNGRAYEDNPRWAPDGKAIYFVSSTGGPANVMARRFDPQAGRPSGSSFAVTRFDAPNRMMPAAARREISVASRDLFIPITEARGHVWLLDHVDR
jgi:Tol biopolymer transport system component/DNA-binding winged helix-turn-helix (wHTH) protein